MGIQSAARRSSDAGSSADFESSATTPLLQGHNNTTAHDHHHHDHADAEPTIHHHHKTHPKFFAVVLIILSLLLVVSFGDFMNKAPFLRIQEDIVCRAYYRNTFPNEFENPYEPIPEDRCKAPDIQGRLANLRGWDQTLSCIPSVLTAVPYGVVADKYGRKIVMILSLLGLFLSLAWAEAVAYFSHYIAIEWYWAGNAFLFIGGGSAVLKSTLFTILADVASEDIRLVCTL